MGGEGAGGGKGVGPGQRGRGRGRGRDVGGIPTALLASLPLPPRRSGGLRGGAVDEVPRTESPIGLRWQVAGEEVVQGGRRK